MPYVGDIVANFKKQYGKNWKKRFFAWKGANPTQYKKGVATARKKGDKIIASLASKNRGATKKNGRG